MRRRFYYHPDNSKQVVAAVIAGELELSCDAEHVACVYMPKTDSEGKPVLGFWITEYEPKDFFLYPPPKTSVAVPAWT